MAKKKYYAVQKGRVPGVYLTWDECKKQVDGFSGAAFKSFSTMEEARQFVKGAAGKPDVRAAETRKYDRLWSRNNSSYYTKWTFCI